MWGSRRLGGYDCEVFDKSGRSVGSKAFVSRLLKEGCPQVLSPTDATALVEPARGGVEDGGKLDLRAAAATPRGRVIITGSDGRAGLPIWREVVLDSSEAA